MALILLNLRGVKESVAALVPIFLVFIVTHASAIVYGISTHAGATPTMSPRHVRDMASGASWELRAMIFLILRAYSMGAGTFTGIEAVSNGIPILRRPEGEDSHADDALHGRLPVRDGRGTHGCYLSSGCNMCPARH